MAMTNHANTRSQQRAIPPMLIDLLLQFGKSEAAGNGVAKMFFDKQARKRVAAYAGPLARMLDEHLDLYAFFTLKPFSRPQNPSSASLASVANAGNAMWPVEAALALGCRVITTSSMKRPGMKRVPACTWCKATTVRSAMSEFHETG